MNTRINPDDVLAHLNRSQAIFYRDRPQAFDGDTASEIASDVAKKLAAGNVTPWVTDYCLTYGYHIAKGPYITGPSKKWVKEHGTEFDSFDKFVSQTEKFGDVWWNPNF